jgi:cytochrome c-type biogenesis protein CcmH
MKRLVLSCIFALAAAAGFAKEAVPLAADPVVEQRLIAITQDLRCLVCQNESLAASQAELAQDLRREVREMIRAGRSDDQIRSYLVARYGDFVLYKPPLKPTTWLLWGGPFALLFAAIAGFIAYVRRAKGRAAEEGIAGDAGEQQA